MKLRDTLLIMSAFIFIDANLSGCIVRGPKTENKHVLDKLNGENYDTNRVTGADSVPIPLLTTKARTSQISGHAEMRNGVAPVPLRFAHVELVDANKKVLTKASTDSDGNFRLSGVIANGNYSVRVSSQKFAGTQPVTINDYDTSGLVIIAEPKAY